MYTYIYIDVYFKSSPLSYSTKTGHFAFAKIEFTTYLFVVSLRTSLTLIQPFNGCMESLIFVYSAFCEETLVFILHEQLLSCSA